MGEDHRDFSRRKFVVKGFSSEVSVVLLYLGAALARVIRSGAQAKQPIPFITKYRNISIDAHVRQIFDFY